jgi:hypothetical protein
MREMAVDISEVIGVPLVEVEPQVRTLIRRFRTAKLLVPSRTSAPRKVLADV